MSYQIRMQIIVLLSFVVLSIQAAPSNPGIEARCSLDGMRDFIINACKPPETTVNVNKRQINNNLISSWESSKHYGKHHHLKLMKVEHEDYPEGGFLIVQHHTANKIISKIDGSKYKLSKVNFSSKEHRFYEKRNKRANSKSLVAYCCEHSCDSKNFCL